MPRFNFDDGLSKVTNKRKSKSNPHHIPLSTGAGVGTGYPSEVSDADSMTYSASSSQAGESTDSSSFDYGGFQYLEKEQQRLRNNGMVGNYNRQNSGVDSLGYSDDDFDGEPYQNYGTTIAGQPSDSYENDRRFYPKTSPSPKSITHQKSPVSIAGDFHSSSGSTGTPNTPPPRHSSRKMTAQETEVWYQKWWMCGFTDALNLNQP